jgi:PhoPQ-activated pathogenicity-related protein
MIFPLIALVTAFGGGQTATVSEPPRELYNYLQRSDDSFTYTVDRRTLDTRINMTSQTWQGIPWKHSIMLLQPPKSSAKGVAVLYITGDGPRPTDYVEMGMITAGTNLPVATLFNIPNQPIWDMKEDDLIAHTFERYLETKDESWPLLFPMTKAAIRAMDAVQAATKDTENPIERFVVAGASKRGWTTWFVGAAQDPRVIGIAPLVIDNLNVQAQMPHQLASWGKYSEQIEEYTRRGLQQKLDSPEGKVLARMVDPYHYRQNITVPTLIVNGANDPYWTVDALSKYYGDLKQPVWTSIVPNAGHELGNRVQAIETFGAFANTLARGDTMLRPEWELIEDASAGPNRILRARILPGVAQPHTVRVWTAESFNLDFRRSKWEVAGTRRIETPQPPLAPWLRVEIPADRNVAVLVDARFNIDGRSFTISRPVSVIKRR